MRKRIISTILTLVLALGVVAVYSQSTLAVDYSQKTLAIDWNKIREVGYQTYSGPCGAYSLAYCRTMLDGYVHYYTEYYIDEWSHWHYGSYVNGYYPSEKLDGYRFLFSEIEKGKPVIIKVQGTGGYDHYVAVVGYENVYSLNSLSANNFLIIDPNNYSFSTENLGYKGLDLRADSNGTYQIVYDGSDKTVGVGSATPTCNHDYKTIKNTSGAYVAVCKNCGSEYQLGEINTADAGIYKTTAKIILNSAPYKESQVGNEIAKGTSFTVVGSVLNAYGNKWYRTKEGRWIYKDYLTRTGDLPASEDKLSISGANYPSSLAVGNIFIIYGTVNSERSNIKTLTVSVYDENGNEKTGKTVSPNATSYDIHKVDVDIRFDWLTDGIYYYRITATNSSETVRLLNQKFTVGTGKSASTISSPTAATIAEGYYTLTPACAPNMRLDVSGADKGANVWIWTANGSDPQTFRFTGTDSGYYSITSKYSGMVLDAWGASTESGTNVAQHPAADYFNASSGINQQWKLVDAGGGYYEIISRMSDSACLDVNGAGNTEQTNVQIWERNGSDAQRWKLTFVASSAPIHTHSLTKTPAKAATCTAAGNSAYWYCSGCNKYFSDASGENEITLAQTTVNALGHSYANGKCTRCGADDPNYIKPVENVCLPQQTVYPLGKFTDVPMNQWFYSGVVSAFELGLMKGNSASTFNPYGDVTIAEAITMAARIHNIYTNGSETIRAAGTGEQWYQPYLDYAYENGIIKYAYYNCDVSQRATRAQFAEIFARALPDKALAAINSVGDNAIPDVSASDSYASYVYKLYRAGILAGSDANGTFHPSTFITRSEAATIVSRMGISDNRVNLTLN